jgi:hypothetical protein
VSIKSFFASMNLARWIMVLGGVGAVALAANGWRLYSQRQELDQALRKGGKVEQTINRIQYLGKLVTKLQADADREGLTGMQADPSSYFRALAAHEKVRLGSVDIRAESPQEVYRGTQDFVYSIKPASDKGYARDKIMNYLYMVEQQSRRLKVTQIQMTPEQRQQKEWEVGNDLWKWNLQVTSRTKEERKDG